MDKGGKQQDGEINQFLHEYGEPIQGQIVLFWLNHSKIKSCGIRVIGFYLFYALLKDIADEQ